MRDNDGKSPLDRRSKFLNEISAKDSIIGGCSKKRPFQFMHVFVFPERTKKKEKNVSK